MRLAFLVNDLQLSGGVGVVLEHAVRLGTDHGFDVTLVLAREQEDEAWRYSTLEGTHVLDLPAARALRFDVAIATWWETALVLFELQADRHVYFVQSLEDRFYLPHQRERPAAAATLALPVAFITEATWIADTLHDVRPDADVHLVRNGIDKAAFSAPERIERRDDGPLRVLVEGNPAVWFKHVAGALQAAAMMGEPHEVTFVSGHGGATNGLPFTRRIGPLTHAEMAAAYAQTDVVLKLSSVEGMFGPPLEGMHMGATCVVTPVTGHEEYVRHGVNGLICDWDDLPGTARLLDLLARDRDLLHRLREGALDTARAWPSWERQAQEMAAALRAIAAAPEPAAAGVGIAMASEIRLSLARAEIQNVRVGQVIARAERIERIKQLPGIAQVHWVWHRPVIQRRVAPVVMRAAKRAVGRS